MVHRLSNYISVNEEDFRTSGVRSVIVNRMLVVLPTVIMVVVHGR